MFVFPIVLLLINVNVLGRFLIFSIETLLERWCEIKGKRDRDTHREKIFIPLLHFPKCLQQLGLDEAKAKNSIRVSHTSDRFKHSNNHVTCLTCLAESWIGSGSKTGFQVLGYATKWWSNWLCQYAGLPFSLLKDSSAEYKQLSSFNIWNMLSYCLWSPKFLMTNLLFLHIYKYMYFM